MLAQDRVCDLGGRADGKAILGEVFELGLGRVFLAEFEPWQSPRRISSILREQEWRRAPQGRFLVEGARYFEQAHEVLARGQTRRGARRLVHVQVARHFVDTCCRHRRPAISNLAGPLDGGVHMRGDDDGRARLGRRLRPDGQVLELIMAALVRDFVFGPQALDDFDVLGEARHAALHVDAEHGELFRPVAQPHAEQEPAAGDDVHEGSDLGQFDRIVQRQQHDIRADFEAFGFGGEPLEHRQQGIVMIVVGDVMLAAPDRIEAELFDQPDLLDRLGKPPRRIVGGWMLRVQINPELHCGLPCSGGKVRARREARQAGRIPQPRGPSSAGSVGIR